MSYTALYRKFRPEIFDDVKGQEHIVKTLKNQITKERLSHAYLFCGTRGTGKTTVAKILAKAVNCQNPIDGSPCGQCEMCKKISSGASTNVVEIDAASNNGVANVREIIDEVQYSPAEGKFRVYIIDEVHMLSAGAFNALLKTLEEPPSYVMFVLATTEAHKIPITILSRCQRYDFKRITIDTISARLKELVEIEGVEAEDKALRYIAKLGDGSMRDSLSLLDQCMAFYMGEKLDYEKVLDVLGAVDTSVYSKVFVSVKNNETVEVMNIIDRILFEGRDIGQFVNEFCLYLRNLMFIAASGDASDELIDASAEVLANMKEEAALSNTYELIEMIKAVSELSAKLKYASNKRIIVEIAFIMLCNKVKVGGDKLGELEKKVNELEKRLDKVVESGVQSGSGNASAKRNSGAIRAVAPKELPKSLPEDVRRIIEHWDDVVEVAPGAMGRYLSSAKKNVNEDGSLLLQFFKEIEAKYFTRNDGANRKFVENIIAGIIGKSMQVSIQLIAASSGEEDVPDISSLINYGDIEMK